jgi:hypothetical protein
MKGTTQFVSPEGMRGIILSCLESDAGDQSRQNREALFSIPINIINP